jgi:RNA polymerase sigma-70 factor (ECF subfamily)
MTTTALCFGLLLVGVFASVLGQPPDEELVRRSQAGDARAYGELVRRYQDRIYSLCLRWLRSPDLAEELAQDTFVSAWRGIGSFRGEARFSTWIFRIAVNLCKNKRLYNQRRAYDRHDPADSPGEERSVQLVDPSAGTDRETHRSEAERLLQAALADLDEGYRAIILLRDIEGMDYGEIASLLDLPVGTVKSRLHRARGHLAAVLHKGARPDDVLD